MVRKSAQYLRERVRTEYTLEGAAFPIVELIEKWGSMPEHGCPGFDILEDHELAFAPAEFMPKPTYKFHIRESVWIKACNGDPEARETLAHEVGHCWLNHPAFSLQRASVDDFHTTVKETDSECQANWFLIELLMDIRLIETKHSVNALMEKFNVTEELATLRLRELINERRLSRYFSDND